MRGSKLLVVSMMVLALCVVAPLAGAEEDLTATLMEMERALWKGWAEADSAPFHAHLSDVVVNLTGGGTSAGKAALVAEIESGECEVTSWELGDATLHQVKEDVAIVTYDATQEATCGGQVIDGALRVASLWVRFDGEWKTAGHFETAGGE